MRMARVICRSSSRSAGGRLLSSLWAAESGRLVERQSIAAAQLARQRHQRQRLGRREIDRRQKVGAGNRIAIVFFVECDRHAGRIQRFDVAKDRAAAYAAGLAPTRQRFAHSQTGAVRAASAAG